MKAEISWKCDVPLAHQNYRLNTRLEMSWDDGRTLSMSGVLIHMLLLYLYSLVCWCDLAAEVPANFSEISLSIT